jgi:putative Holliday junction resolvase
MIILGVDYGTKRIGIATGDSSTRLAFPLRTVDGTDVVRAVDEIVTIAKEEAAERVVVGVPRPLARADGTARKNVEQEALAFAESIRAKTALPVEIEDERFSSRMADRWRKLSETKKKNFNRDAAAAAAILETYIERVFRSDAA